MKRQAVDYVAKQKSIDQILKIANVQILKNGCIFTDEK
jgi:hypothetical protein